MIPNAEVQGPITVSLQHADKAREAVTTMTAAVEAYAGTVNDFVAQTAGKLTREFQRAMDAIRIELEKLGSEVAAVEKRADDTAKKAKAAEQDAEAQIRTYKEHVAEHERAASIAAGKVQALNAKLDILRQKTAALIDE